MKLNWTIQVGRRNDDTDDARQKREILWKWEAKKNVEILVVMAKRCSRWKKCKCMSLWWSVKTLGNLQKIIHFGRRSWSARRSWRFACASMSMLSLQPLLPSLDERFSVDAKCTRWLTHCRGAYIVIHLIFLCWNIHVCLINETGTQHTQHNN